MTYNGITVSSKSAGHAGPPSEKFAGRQASLRAIGPRASLILTPDDNNTNNNNNTNDKNISNNDTWFLYRA